MGWGKGVVCRGHGMGLEEMRLENWVLKAWSMDQQHQQPGGCKKCKFLDLSPNLLGQKHCGWG